MLQAIERYMKQAIVDKNPAVSSAALVSSLHLARSAGELVKRWVNEAQEAFSSDKYVFCFTLIFMLVFSNSVKIISSMFRSVMVQYHALGLMYHIRKTDRLAVIKLVTKLTKQSLKSPFAVCLLVRKPVD